MSETFFALAVLRAGVGLIWVLFSLCDLYAYAHGSTVRGCLLCFVLGMVLCASVAILLPYGFWGYCAFFASPMAAGYAAASLYLLGVLLGMLLSKVSVQGSAEVYAPYCQGAQEAALAQNKRKLQLQTNVSFVVRVLLSLCLGMFLPEALFCGMLLLFAGEVCWQSATIVFCFCKIRRKKQTFYLAFVLGFVGMMLGIIVVS